MSVVTNVILTLPVLSDIEKQKVAEAINLSAFYGGQLIEVSNYSLGSKYMEASVFIGAYNHLDESMLKKWLVGPLAEALNDGLYHVQVFMKRQEDEGFAEVFNSEKGGWL